MDEKTNHDDNPLDSAEEYFNSQNKENEGEAYFPIEESRPPHY